MTSYEAKGYILETLKNEIEKTVSEQSKWKTHLFFCPEIAQFILNDNPISSKNVFELLKAEFIVYDGIKLHQGEDMPSGQINLLVALLPACNHS